MKKRYGWLLMFSVAAMLVAACGPGEPTTAPSEETRDSATQAPQEVLTKEPSASPEIPLVAEGDWRVLGSADAAVTIVEYTDFQ